MHELTTVAFSHYVEKARWALDRFGVAYVDHRYLPMLHFAGVYRVHGGKLGKTDKASTKLSTPVLKTDRGEVLCDSADIVRYVSDRYAPPGYDLYPSDEVAALEQRVHDKLGPHTRRVAYAACFGDRAVMRDLAHHNVGPLQAAAFVAALPLIERNMRKLLRVHEPHIQRSIDKTRREMDVISERLADGRPFLVGDRFTAADLAFACMAAPVLLPPEYSSWLPPAERLPDDIEALCRELREQPAGQFARRMFRDERRRVIERESYEPSGLDAISSP